MNLNVEAHGLENEDQGNLALFRRGCQSQEVDRNRFSQGVFSHYNGEATIQEGQYFGGTYMESLFNGSNTMKIKWNGEIE